MLINLGVYILSRRKYWLRHSTELYLVIRQTRPPLGVQKGWCELACNYVTNLATIEMSGKTLMTCSMLAGDGAGLPSGRRSQKERISVSCVSRVEPSAQHTPTPFRLGLAAPDRLPHQESHQGSAGRHQPWQAPGTEDRESLQSPWRQGDGWQASERNRERKSKKVRKNDFEK